MSYNIFNNILSITAGGTTSGVSSVAGKTGAVTLVSNDITDFQPNVSSNLDVVDNKTKTQNIDKTLTVLNSTKLNGDLIASKFRTAEYYDETGTSGIKITQTTGEITLNSNSYISNIGKFLKIDTNGLIIPDAVGNIVGPAFANDEAIARYDINGQKIQNSIVSITDSGIITGASGINLLVNSLVQGSVATFEGAVFRGNNFLDTENVAKLINNTGDGVAIASDGRVRLTNALYTGDINRAVTLATNGSLQKSGVFISPAGDILANIITANSDISGINISANQALRTNDVINLTNNAGINIEPLATGGVSFTGTKYNIPNRLLYISNVSGEVLPYNPGTSGSLLIDNNGIISVGGSAAAGQNAVLYATTNTFVNSVSNNFVTIALNEIRGNIAGLVFTNTNFTLPIGRYKLSGRGTAYRVDHTRLALYDTLNTVYIDDTLASPTVYSSSLVNPSMGVTVIGDWYLNLTAPTEFQLKQYTETLQNTGQGGISVSFTGSWTYASLSITAL